MVAAFRGAGDEVQTDHIGLLELVLVQRGIERIAVFIGTQNGHLAVDGEHPAGPGAVGLVAGGEGIAVRVRDAGDVAGHAAVGIAAPGEHIQQGVRRGAAVTGGAGVGAAGQARKRAEAIAVDVDGHGDGLEIGILNALRADYGDGGGDGLLIELGELRVGGIALELLVVLGVLGVGQNAVDGDAGVVLGLGQQQVLVGDDGAVAGAEAAVLLRVVPAGDVVGLDADGVVGIHVADKLIAVAVRDDLDERAHVAGDAVAVAVCLADALPVDVLGADLRHEGRRRVQLVLCQGLDGQGDVLAREHGHGVVVLALAAGTGENLHRHGDGLGALAGQRAVGHHARDVRRGRIGGDDHAVVARAEQDGRVLAVEVLIIVAVGDGIELPRGRELDVGGDARGVDGRAILRIVQTVFGQRGLEQGLIVELAGRGVALDVDGVDPADREILAAVIGQRQRQGHGGILLRERHRGLVGGEIGGGDVADGDDGRVAGAPRGGRPQLKIVALVIVDAARVHTGLQGILGQAGEIVRALHRLGDGDAVGHGAQGGHGLRLIEADDEVAPGALPGIGLAVGTLTAQDDGGADIALGGGRGAVRVPLILDRTVGGDAHIGPAVGDGLLHRHGDVRDPGGGQLGADHGQGIFVCAVGGGVVAGDGGVSGAELLLGRGLLGGLLLRPDGVEVKRLVVRVAVPVVIVPRAVDGGAVGVGDGGAGAAGAPARELIALAGEGALRQRGVLPEGDNLIGHRAGGGALVAVLDVELDDVLVVAPLGDQRHLVAGEHGILGDGLAEGAVGVLDVPALQRLVGGEIGAAGIGQTAEHLVGRHGLVRDGVLVAVAVEVDGDALRPVGIHDKAVFGIGGGELIGQADFIAALSRVEPAVKDVARPDGIGHLTELGAAALGDDIVVVAADDTGAGDILRPLVVELQRDIHGQASPRGIERDGLALLAGEVCDGLFVLIGAVGGAGIGSPAAEAVARAGEGVLRQRDLLVIGRGDALHRAGALVRAEGDGIGDGRPLRRAGHITRDDRLRGQLRIAAEPAAEGIAALGGGGGQTAADGAALRDENLRGAAVVVKRDGIGVRPHRIQVEIRFKRDGGTVLIQDLAAGRSGPAHEDLAVTGEGVGRQGALAAVDLLLDGIVRAVVGVERDEQRRPGGEIPQIDAVVVLVGAAVLLIDNLQHVAALCVDLQRLPALVAALAVYERGAPERDGTLVVAGLGGDLVLEGHVDIAREGELQRAAGAALARVAGYEDVLTVKRRDLPLVRAAGGAGLGFRDDRQTLKIALERRRGKGRHGDETQRHDEDEQHGENALFHVFFPFVQISRQPAGRCFCAQKSLRRRSGAGSHIRRQRTGSVRRPGVGRRPTGRSAYLTYPAQPGITVTHSRGISPHSARPSDRADRPIHMLFYAGQTLPAEIVCDNRSIAQVSFYCKGGRCICARAANAPGR